MLNTILSILLLFLLSPLMIAVVIIILLDDGFPVFFKQKRIGHNNREFLIYKFRTMKKDTPDIPTHLLKDFNPVTRYGFLRKFSLTNSHS